MKTTPAEQPYINLLKQRIEAQMAWGDSAHWTHQDFNELSERIWEGTQTKLSASTLKRLWGKVQYRSQPTTNTLNALAQFVGYEHWRDFVGRHPVGRHPVGRHPVGRHPVGPHPIGSCSVAQKVTEQPATAATKETIASPASSPWWSATHWSGRRLVWAISIPLLVITAFFFNRWINHSAGGASPGGAPPGGAPPGGVPLTVDPSTVSFTSEPVTLGLPNTVVFHYDVSATSSQDVAIQQSWDERLRTSVSPNQDTYTATYYYPGYFGAKLLVDGQVVKEHDLYIRSDGWMTTAEAVPIPHYLPTHVSSGQMQVSEALLQQKKLLTRDEAPWIRYCYVEDLGALSANDFTLETRIKNDYNQGEAVCQESRVSVICSKGHYAIPLAIPGCVGQLSMALGTKGISGTTHDLSALGYDLSQWQTLRLEVRNRQVTVYVNDQPVWKDSYTDDAGKIAGLRYRFHGPGAVDYVRLLDGGGELVYAEDFEESI